MANTKISQLPAATTLTTGDLLPVVQGGATKQVTLDLLPISAATTAALSGKETAGAAAAAQAAAVQRANHTGTQSADTVFDGATNKAYTAAEKTKLAGIAAGATVNRADTATDTAITAAISNLVGAAPAALDTLKEIDDQLTADEGAAAALAALVGTKAPLASPAFTGTPTVNGTPIGAAGGATIDDTTTSSSKVWSSAQVAATYLPKWQPNTAYASGVLIVNPSGQIVQANSAFTSGTTYNATNWTIVTGGAGGSGAAIDDTTISTSKTWSSAQLAASYATPVSGTAWAYHSTRKLVSATPTSDVAILLLGDSTLLGTTPWPRKLGIGLQAAHPQYGLVYRVLDGTTETFKTDEQVATGTSGFNIVIVNVSYSGRVAMYYTGRIRALYAGLTPDAVLVSQAWNMPSTSNFFRGQYVSAVEDVRSMFPDADFALVAENAPLASQTTLASQQATRVSEVRKVAAQLGVGLIDLFSLFIDNGPPVSWIQAVDGFHPTTDDGTTQIANELLRHFVFRQGLSAKTRAVPSLLAPSGTLAPLGLLRQTWDGTGFPSGWGGVNVTASKETTNYETGSYAVTFTSTAASGYAYFDLPAEWLPWLKGRTLSLTARLYVANGQVATVSSLGCDFSGDGTASNQAASADGQGGYRFETFVVKVPTSATRIRTRIYASLSTGAAGQAFTIDRLIAHIGDLPRDVLELPIPQAASATTDIQVFTASGTWTKPAGVTTVIATCIGGGGGGGAGALQASGAAASGGAGGGGGGISQRTFAATLLGATEAVTVGVGGTGGTAQTINSTAGGAGGAGGSTLFGTAHCLARPGTGGGGGALAAASAAGAAGGALATGGAGGVGANGAAGVGGTMGSGAPGGSGGGGISTGAAAFAGAAGAATASGVTATATAGANTGGVGGTGTSAAAGEPTPGGSGAGGGANVAGAGGAGGSGGLYGAGGGGGGAALNGATSGAGGAGAAGIVVVVSF